MSLPPIADWREVHRRLQLIFPDGTPNRDRAVWEVAARSIFVMLYVGAVEGKDRWIRPDQVTRMTDHDAADLSDQARERWAIMSVRPGKGEIPGRWYAVNTRESIRDDTIRYSLIANGAVIERSGVATTSSAGRYALQSEFAELFDSTLDEATLLTRAEAWREKNLNPGALARVALVRRGAVGDDARILVTFPNKETRSLAPGASSKIVKAVVEVFAPAFLEKPGVISLSESGNKVVSRDDELSKAIGLKIIPEKNLPDVVLVDLGPSHPRLIFVEAVATDGPVNELRKEALLNIATDAGFPAEQVSFVTAYLDRGLAAFKRTAHTLAWGTYAWFASEPDKLIVLADEALPLS